MRIGELAEATGVSARSLRYYEEQGLIRSSRTSGGWRDFDATSVERVVMISNRPVSTSVPPSTSCSPAWRPRARNAPA